MKIKNWPSTQANLITGWALFVGTVLVGWVALLFRLGIDESLYTVLIVATGAWAGVAAPAWLIEKRKTTNPDVIRAETEAKIVEARLDPNAGEGRTTAAVDPRRGLDDYGEPL